MKIIKLTEKDLPEALMLVWSVFNEFEAPEYHPEGVKEFREFITYDNIIGMYRNQVLAFWGCFIDDGLVGVIAAKNTNHISLLFVKKAYHRQGIAKNLFLVVLRDCIDKEHTSITVNSSPYAKEAYLHLGFTATDSEQVKNGIRYIPMVYTIKIS